MLFSIPETNFTTDENGSKFWMFHVHVNDVLHCKVRYRQLAELHDQLKKEFDDQVPSKLFPGKKLFGLSTDQLEDRRHMLECYLQTIVQDSSISSSDIFNDFFRDAQKATRKASSEEVALDIYLMNGNKFTVNILSTQETEEVLELAMRKIGLSHQFYHYFALYLMKIDDENDMKSLVVRKLQDFESPYLSLVACKEHHRVVVRKSYWSSSYDNDIIDDRIALNLLFVQVLDDIERGWVLTTEKDRQRLAALKKSGSKKEFLYLARSLKFYGYIRFNPCICDYPVKNSVAVFSVGERELHMSVTTDEKSSVKEGRFQVQAIRCWKLCSAATKASSSEASSLQFSFEYFFGKDKLQWINVESDQGILISMSLQGIVDEIIRENEGKPIRLPKSRRKSDSSSTSSQASSKSQKKQVSNVLDEIEEKTKDTSKKKNGGKNKVFEDIGDDDL